MKDDLLYIKKKFIREVEKNILRKFSFENSDQNEYVTNLKEITNKTVVDTLQDLVDQGKIQHAFIIYSLFKNSIQVPDKILRHWSHGYLGKLSKINDKIFKKELLRSHKMYKLMNKCLKDSKIKEIKESNKVIKMDLNVSLILFNN